MVPVVACTAGVTCLFAVLFTIIIWQRVRPQLRNDNPPPHIDHIGNHLLDEKDSLIMVQLVEMMALKTPSPVQENPHREVGRQV